MQSSSKFSKTRIAPTPSGFLHIGNARSFAVTAALAAQTGAAVLLRIDDMDRNRLDELYVQDIFDTLHFLNIPWQEGPENSADFERNWSQRHRLHLYDLLLQQLAEKDLVYACTCSRSDILRAHTDGIYTGTCRHRNIPLDTPDACWRLKTDSRYIVINTLHSGAQTVVLPAAMTDFVVRKKDGFPAYQLSSLADDVHFGVDLIVRGEDLYHSTLAQLWLADLLGLQQFGDTVFYHHSLVKEPDGKKLSKSAGATSIQFLRKQGSTAEDIYAEIGLMLGLKTRLQNWQQLKEEWLQL
jgi:glutamyl/glutaminyl-tRNA synthetase